jgi:porin
MGDGERFLDALLPADSVPGRMGAFHVPGMWRMDDVCSTRWYGQNRANLKENILIKPWIAAIGAVLCNAVTLLSAQAYDITERVWVGGVIAGVYQYQFLDDDDDGTDEGGGAAAFQPEIGFRLTDADTIFVKFGFAADNALGEKTPFTVSPWAADLEADVKNINGRDRDYLLTAWYQHVFEFKADYTLSVTAGLIDATDYLDDNAFSNDEYTQFMNGALVNGPHAFLPSYDMGGALELTLSRFALRAVVMNIGENDDWQRLYVLGCAAVVYTGDATWRGHLPSPGGWHQRRLSRYSGHG